MVLRNPISSQNCTVTKLNGRWSNCLKKINLIPTTVLYRRAEGNSVEYNIVIGFLIKKRRLLCTSAKDSLTKIRNTIHYKYLFITKTLRISFQNPSLELETN